MEVREAAGAGRGDFTFDPTRSPLTDAHTDVPDARQDAHLVVENLTADLSLFGVFDGHGGPS